MTTTIHAALAKKLHPARFSDMSGKMAAILGFMLGESWSNPEMVSLYVTSDGFIGTANAFLGDAKDYVRNIDTLLDAAGVTAEERAYWLQLEMEKIDFWHHLTSLRARRAS